MEIIDKTAFLKSYYDLYARGEILKAHIMINQCVPLILEDDADIIQVRNECNDRVREIKEWSKFGRPYPGTYAKLDNPLVFPKFQKAFDIISQRGGTYVLDVGTYNGAFLSYLAKHGYICTGVDVHKELMQILDTEHQGNPKFLYGQADHLSDVLEFATFDIVMLFDVLEHCFSPEAVISEVDKVAKDGALVMINLPRTSLTYTDDASEHLMMFSDRMIHNYFGDRKNFKLELCQDELGRDTSFITYNV